MISFTLDAIIDLTGVQEANLLLLVPDVPSLALIAGIDTAELARDAICNIARNIFTAGRIFVPSKAFRADLTLARPAISHVEVAFAEVADGEEHVGGVHRVGE